MPLINVSTVHRLQGSTVPPIEGEWMLLTRQRYDEAEYDWQDCHLFEVEATKEGEPLTLEEALTIERMIREQVAADEGGPLETLIYYKVSQLPTGVPITNYKVVHAAHASPVAWLLIIGFIAANWKVILIAMGLAAAAALITTFVIKGSQIVWHAGQAIDDFLEEAGPVVAIGAGVVLLIVAIGVIGAQRKKAKE
ncbi:hypothetical protein ES703_91492 [subsurface metagenome]